MTGLLENNPQVLLSHSLDPKRKTKYTVEMIQNSGEWVGVHSSLANKMVKNALNLGIFPEVGEFYELFEEVSIDVTDQKQCIDEEIFEHTNKKCKGGGISARTVSAKKCVNPNVTANKMSRIDFVLSCDNREREVSPVKRKASVSQLVNALIGKKTFMEVKSVTLHRYNAHGETKAEFPDTVSERAQKHISLLTDIARKGKDNACIIYLIQRGDCQSFSPSFENDPTYSSLVLAAIEAGVKVLPYSCTLEESGKVRFNGLLPVDIEKQYIIKTETIPYFCNSHELA